MNGFLAFIAAHGIIAPDCITPGKWQRCRTENHPRKKNGSIKLADDGQVGWCQDYAVHAEPLMWRAGRAGPLAAPLDRALIARRQAERRAALAAATLSARSRYAQCAPLRNEHPYLAGKGFGVAGCHGLRVDAAGALVVPMLCDGAILSLQRIAADGEKRFHPGATTRGACYVIERPGATVTAFAEGFATGLTIFHAVPACRVVVAFNAGNLPVVASARRPAGLAVVCADNDWETAARIGRNPGLEYAREAAALLGVGVAYPECAGSDWNDFLSARLEARAAAARPGLRHGRGILQMQAGVFAEIKHKVMREARLVRPM